MRIAGVLVPVEKKVGVALTYVYGVGPRVSAALCEKAKVSSDKRVKDLTTKEEDALRDGLGEFVVEADLRREIGQNVKRLQDIGSYRGFRHRRRLPVRGQKTKTNARTRKGRKGAAVTKKKVATK